MFPRRQRARWMKARLRPEANDLVYAFPGTDRGVKLPEGRPVGIVYATAVEPTAAAEVHTSVGVAKLMLRAEALDAALAITLPQELRKVKSSKAREEQQQLKRERKITASLPRTANIWGKSGGGRRPISKGAAAGAPGLGKRK